VTPFDSAESYRSLGWSGTIPLPPALKFPPPAKVTGEGGRFPDPTHLMQWRRQGYVTRDENGVLVKHRAHNIGLRLPPVALGLDVDAYDGKPGEATLAELQAKLGPLPATWRTTSRCDISGIRLFGGVPPGLVFPSEAGPGIEIIRYAHRYAVVPPSVHPTGATYRWVGPDGTDTDAPRLGDLPALPKAWIDHLTGGGHTESNGHRPGSRAAGRAGRAAGREWITRLPGGSPCAYVAQLAADVMAAARREDGNAYDYSRDAVLALLRAGERDHPGVPEVLERARTVYVATVGADRGGNRFAESEFLRFTETGAVKVLETPSEPADIGCDCAQDDDAESEKGVSEEASPEHPQPDGDQGSGCSGDAPSDTTFREWAVPVPLHVDLPELPLGDIAPVLRDLVAEVAEATQTPPDVAFMMALAAVSTATVGAFQVEVQRGWFEVLSLYTVAALPSGARKSAVVQMIAAPLVHAEQLLALEARAGITEDLTLRQVREDQAQAQRKKAAKSKAPEDEADLVSMMQALKRMEEDAPVEPRLLAEDVTAERLAVMMAEQGGAMGVLSAEGTILHTLVDRYTDSPNVDLLLKAHPGEPYRVDRMSRPSIHLARTHLGLGLAIQPVILDHVGEKKLLLRNGFLNRFLFAIPRNLLGTRLLHPAPVSLGVEAAWNHRISALLQAGRTQRAQDCLATCTLTPAAAELLDAFRAHLEPRLHPQLGDLTGITEWASKLPGALVRIAALTTLLEEPDARTVEAVAMRHALDLADYLIAHAREAFRRMTSTSRHNTTEAGQVLRWITDNDLASFTTRDAFQGLRGQAWVTEAADVQHALDTLETAEYVRRRPPPATRPAGRPPSPTYDVNPHLTQKHTVATEESE
jgi:hypothetical protein